MAKYRPFGEAASSLAIPQEVRASPPNPSAAAPAAAIVKPEPIRASPLRPPMNSRQALYTQRPFNVAMVLQGLGDAPIGIPQPVPASPLAAPSNVMLANRQPVRASPTRPPRNNREAIMTQRKFDVAMVLQAGGMNGAPIQAATINGAPIQATNINGAPVAVSTIGAPGSLAMVNMDTSVSAQVRANKQLGALRDNGVPVSGDYTDAIRNAAGFAFGPKRMPKQGFMAASYSYPAQQMVVGATLQGTPIVNMQPTQGVSPAPAPRFVTRGGGSIRNQISSSPSEERRRLLSTLQGLGAAPNTTIFQDWNNDIQNFLEDAQANANPAISEAAVAIHDAADKLPDKVKGYVFGKAADYVGKKVSMTLGDALKEAVGDTVYDLATGYSCGVGKPADWCKYLGTQLNLFREAFIRWAYGMIYSGAQIKDAWLAAAMADKAESAGDLAKLLMTTPYNPDATTPPQAAGSSGTPSGGGATPAPTPAAKCPPGDFACMFAAKRAGTKAGLPSTGPLISTVAAQQAARKTQDAIKAGMVPVITQSGGMTKISYTTPKAAVDTAAAAAGAAAAGQAAPAQFETAAATTANGGGSNTMLLVGGVAIAAIAAFVLMKK